MRAQGFSSEENLPAGTLNKPWGVGQAERSVAGKEQKTIGAWRMTWRRLQRSHTALFGMGIACLVFLVAALADVIAPYGYAEMHPEAMLQAPSGTYLLGTDQMAGMCSVG